MAEFKAGDRVLARFTESIVWPGTFVRREGRATTIILTDPSPTGGFGPEPMLFFAGSEAAVWNEGVYPLTTEAVQS